MQEREWLDKLAERNLRTPTNQLRWMIRACFIGRFKDLGDDRVDPRLLAGGVPAVLQAESVVVESAMSGFDETENPTTPSTPLK